MSQNPDITTQRCLEFKWLTFESDLFHHLGDKAKGNRSLLQNILYPSINSPTTSIREVYPDIHHSLSVQYVSGTYL